MKVGLIERATRARCRKAIHSMVGDLRFPKRFLPACALSRLIPTGCIHPSFTTIHDGGLGARRSSCRRQWLHLPTQPLGRTRTQSSSQCRPHPTSDRDPSLGAAPARSQCSKHQHTNTLITSIPSRLARNRREHSSSTTCCGPMRGHACYKPARSLG